MTGRLRSGGGWLAFFATPYEVQYGDNGRGQQWDAEKRAGEEEATSAVAQAMPFELDNFYWGIGSGSSSSAASDQDSTP
jgi:hypothetical protein